MVDVRGPRFAAWLTTAVLAVVLLTGSGLLLGAQVAVFALGATTVGLVAAGLALSAARLHAAFGICLGGELHLRIARTTSRTRTGTPAITPAITANLNGATA